MTRAGRVALTLLVWVASAPTASAFLLPSFDLDICGWDATHIVVVSAGGERDGTVVVLESWRGQIRRGEVLRLPSLAAFASPDSRAIPRLYRLDCPNSLTHVTGSRMVLFLRRVPRPDDPTKTAAWKAATREMGLSVVWVEGKEMYVWCQYVNPGPRTPVPLRMTEQEVRGRLRRLARVRTDFDRAAAVPDPAGRAAALCAFVGSDLEIAQWAALESLKGCGEATLPALHKLLADDALTPHHKAVVRTLIEIGGKEIERELVAMLGRELAFWKKEGPKLPIGWQQGDIAGLEKAKVEYLQQRSSAVYEAIGGLRDAQSAASREAIVMLRGFWLSLPQLGQDAISEECDSVLNHLKREDADRAAPTSSGRAGDCGSSASSVGVKCVPEPHTVGGVLDDLPSPLGAGLLSGLPLFILIVCGWCLLAYRRMPVTPL